MIRTVWAVLLVTTLSCGTAAAQGCPTGQAIITQAKATTDDYIARGASVSNEERTRLVNLARASTILTWEQFGIDGLSQTRGGLTTLGSCMSSGGCGFESKSTAAYDYVNTGVVAEVLKAPPPAAAIAWARDKLGCTAVAAPAVALASEPPADTPRPALALVAKDGQAPAGMAELQQSLKIIDEHCHRADTQDLRRENCKRIGDAFYRGVDGYEKDFPLAYYYYHRACHAGDGNACYLYGSSKRDYGQTQAEKDEGLEYIGMACDRGHTMSCTNYEAWTGAPRH